MNTLKRYASRFTFHVSRNTLQRLNRSVMTARRGQYCTFFGFVLAKKVRTDIAPAVTDQLINASTL